MRSVCNACKYFRANSHVGEKPHHCSFQDVALSEYESQQSCDECVAENKDSCH